MLRIMDKRDTFYQDVKPMHNLKELGNLAHYVDVPETWFIALSDVRGSTAAIEAGKYKAINSVAAATICGMLNALPELEIPFVFGGDGASILVPPQGYDPASMTLRESQRLAEFAFGLDLRIGIVPVRDVLAAGYDLKVAKLHLSDNYQQAIFTGGGLSYAEDLLKDPDHDPAYDIPDYVGYQADFSGYECRWNTMPARHDEVISLLVQASGGNIDQRHRTYQDVLGTIDMIYGEMAERHPLRVEQMRVNTNPLDYSVEKGLRPTTGNRWWDGLRLMLWSWLGYFVWRFISKIWEDYKDVVHETTDHEKFDDVLRMTISGSASQRETLETYLRTKHKQGELAYGIHVSEASLMTCIVFDRFGRQVHFIDGVNGGYAQAAKTMKAQLKAMSAQTIATRHASA